MILVENGGTSSSGSSGVSSSGSNGSISGISGTSGGSSSSGSGSGCGLSNSDPTCDACLEASCCSSASACSNDPDCSSLVDCIALAPFTDGGVDACNGAAPTTAQQEYTTFQSCLSTNCQSTCASCHGVPPSCSINASETSCTTAVCLWSGTCSGSAFFCSSLDQYSCPLQEGYYWDTSAMFCSGISSSCSSLNNQFSCGDQQGCFWSPGCTGFSSATCTSFPDSASCISAGCTSG